jgi:hypothetical protein
VVIMKISIFRGMTSCGLVAKYHSACLWKFLCLEIWCNVEWYSQPVYTVSYPSRQEYLSFALSFLLENYTWQFSVVSL